MVSKYDSIDCFWALKKKLENLTQLESYKEDLLGSIATSNMALKQQLIKTDEMATNGLKQRQQ